MMREGYGDRPAERSRGDAAAPHEFAFDSVIFNGSDYTPDGMGNHLSLLDRLVFENMPAECKSLSPFQFPATDRTYGRVEPNRHLEYPGRFKNCLFLDIAREAWDPDAVREQIQKTIAHKRVFNAVAGVYLMWESDRLWDLYAELIACYDFCIVTSSILDGHLQELGIDFVKLRHPYDFALSGHAARAAGRDSTFRFGVSAGLWSRKNVALLAREFLNAFQCDRDVELSIHTRTDVDHVDHRAEYADLERLRDQCYRIEMICQSFSRNDYLGWMRSLDAYCFVSAGEGYSITPREALHLKIPVILLDAHAHREFSHLPGVLSVPSDGVQPAEPNVVGGRYDIGRNWRVDRAALRRAMVDCRRDYPPIRNELEEGYEEILEHHDLDRIKSDWVDVLNRKYEMYRDVVRLDFPDTEGAHLRSMPDIPATLRLGSRHFTRRTGMLARGRVYCLKNKHRVGYCLRGPGAPIRAFGAFTVAVDLMVLETDPAALRADTEIVALEVYDTGARSLVASDRVTLRDARGGDIGLTIAFKAFSGQVLDFNLYWYGKVDLCVNAVRVDRATAA